MAVDREFYVYRFGWPRTGRMGGRWRTEGGLADGRAEGGRQADGRTATDGPAAGTILNDSTTIFIDFHKTLQQYCVFMSFRVRRKRKYRFLQLK